MLDTADDGETSARLRALDALGRAAAWRGDDAALAAAESLLEDALRGCRAHGQLAWAAQVAMPLAAWVHYPAARYERAIALVDDALHDLPIRGRHRAVALTFRGLPGQLRAVRRGDGRPRRGAEPRGADGGRAGAGLRGMGVGSQRLATR